jgi:dTDP-4-amino-4,6-dideoxyglucose formyltransferase
MKKILVVSDNPRLTKFFKEECVKQGVNSIADVTYKYSATNKDPAAMMDLGAAPVDVKSSEFADDLKKSYDLIFSLHCKQIFSSELVSSVTCINVHPGLNPYNRGWYPQVFSIINGNPIGATMHLMDGSIDHGEIIDQIEVDVLESDTSLDVYERVFLAEKLLISRNLTKIINEELSTVEPTSEGNYNSIKDFKSLCHLNLDDVASLGDHIDLLRALSHGTFKNAYFLNKQGNKIFVRVTLEQEGC